MEHWDTSARIHKANGTTSVTRTSSRPLEMKLPVAIAETLNTSTTRIAAHHCHVILTSSCFHSNCRVCISLASVIRLSS
ncbi:hypothetical protein Mapa_017122 [Marchantia paleacea]|nr:hypothetical protein Mapa_017122 [Marchantia paleacea]